MTIKNLISHHKVSDLTKDMPLVQALTTLSRLRAQAEREGLCVTRYFLEGELKEMWIWKH